MSAGLHDTERERGNYWRRRALDVEARVAELEAEVERLETARRVLRGALIESNKIGYSPQQQGSIARRALEDHRVQAASKGKGLNDG